MPENGIRRGRAQEVEGQVLNNGSRHGKARAKPRQQGLRERTVVTEEVLATEREHLIAEKQAQLKTVLDSHDTLVREMFHMDHFLNMIGYDPEGAKMDQSNVFQTYKAMYDLVDKVVPGPSRATRRSRTEQAQLLKATSISTPIPTSTSSPIKKSIKARKNIQASEHLVSSKTKGKARAIDSSLQIREVGLLDDQKPADAPDESISVVVAHRNPRKDDGHEISKTFPPAKRRKITKDGIGESVSSASRRSGRLKGPMGAPLVSEIDASTSVDHHTTQVTAPPLSQRRNIQEPKPMAISAPPAAPKFNIKRIKLLVRRPPPPITHPRQRPPSAKHNSSVNAFLSSYFTLNNQDVDESTVQREVTSDAKILERVEELRKRGRYIPDSDASFVFSEERNLCLTPKRLSKDHWDHLVEAACQAGRFWTKRTSGHQIAGHIAKLIRVYWDGQEARKEKVRVQEERRLRAQAKTVIRMVTDEWKKAVFHIREQERLKLEAEEVRRGREHLDAILDQSGQLLETQQGDLTRGEIPRSRSSSMSLTFRGWGSEEEDDDDDNDEEEADSISDEDIEGVVADNEEAVEDLEEETGQDGSFSHGDHSQLDEDMPSDIDDDTNIQMLLDTPDRPLTPNSVHSSTSEGPTELAHKSLDAYEDVQPNGLTIFTVDETITAEPDSSPQCLSRPQAILDLAKLEAASHEAFSQTSQAPTPLLVTTSTSPDRLNLSLRPSSQPSQLPQSAEKTSILERGTPPDQNTDLPDDPGVPASLYLSTSHTSSTASESSNHSLGRSQSQSPSFVSADQLDIGSSGDLPERISPEYSAPSDSNALTTPATSPPSTSLPQSGEHKEGSIVLPAEAATGQAEELDDSRQETVVEPFSEEEPQNDVAIPEYLKPFAVAPVEWSPDAKVVPPLLLRGILRPYQQSGLEWLASLHTNNLNGILADEMGLGKTIQTISLLAHLACDRGIWGPHLIVVPTSVLLNWEMEFKKFLPGFKVLSYHGSTKRRKELRQGWNDKHHFNVCITSYTLASRDAHIFKRKAWYYMVLDEAHMIKNFRSQRWNILLMFRSFRRLLLTGTPLQNNLTELWALLQFLMSGANFASLKDFGDWFSNPVEKAIEMGNTIDDDTMQRVTKLHTVLRPYLLRRLKRDVEKELPSKYEHLVMCPLSKRQRFLYDEFMSRANTRDALQSGVYQKIANILMQLRKVCNHPDLFEIRPIVTSLAMERSAVADFEIKELLIRRRLMENAKDTVNLGLLGLQFIDGQNEPIVTALETRRLDATSLLPFISDNPGEPPPKDTRTIAGFQKYSAYLQRANTIARWTHIGYLNRLRCSIRPIYSSELLDLASRFREPLLPASSFSDRRSDWEALRVVNSMVKSYDTRAEEMASIIDRFAFVTPPVVALDLPRIVLPGCEPLLINQPATFDSVLHRASVKLQIAFPDPSLLQYDCGKLQELTRLLREKKAGGHRVLIFTQMTKILDILEIFLNFHGYLYLRLDGATRIEDRQYITERFNADPRVFCFIASSRSGGVGINLTGADTVVFYDSDFNPQMDRQCEDRAHRIGQIRDVHIYRFVSQHTVEEALLRKANQKRSLDELVIQKGEFDWRSLFNDEGALSKALEEFEDTEDVHAAAVAATEEVVMQGADEADFDGDIGEASANLGTQETPQGLMPLLPSAGESLPIYEPDEEDVDEGGSVAEYMIAFVQRDYEFFKEWRL
ncbi:hypothetical protein D9615_009140 [Tricholomella constricta]|uniref:DNA helicase n=1 Tax=Tricholomella constricta TaxID=117010 RepID=A0A8H5H2I9_9AGAR|nr:hypothetical protein D9615_009140 [Tricholomella constricta]